MYVCVSKKICLKYNWNRAVFDSSISKTTNRLIISSKKNGTTYDVETLTRTVVGVRLTDVKEAINKQSCVMLCVSNSACYHCSKINPKCLKKLVNRAPVTTKNTQK